MLRLADGQAIAKIAFSADGRWLAAGGQAGALWIWNCDDRRSPPQLVETIAIDRWIEQLTWHPATAHLAISHDSQVKVWDAIANCQSATWQFNPSSVFDLAWHPQGRFLAIAGYKGVQVWSPGDRSHLIHQLDVDTVSIKIAWSSDGRYLAAGNLDRTLKIIDWQHPNDPWILQGCPGKIRHLHWLEGTTSPCLVVGSGSASICWDLPPDTTDWIGHYLAGHQSPISALTVHPHFPTPTSGDRNGYVCLWSEAGEIEQILSDTVSEVSTLSWHARGDRIAVGHLSGAIDSWVASA